DPYEGGKAAVAEAARNVACTGARPLGITNCLNFGNPERPAVFQQFKEACRGIADACRALGTPVTGGNVSFYNESPTGAVPPTPVIGMVGLLPRVDHAVPSFARAAGDAVLVLGSTRGGGRSARRGARGSRAPRRRGRRSEWHVPRHAARRPDRPPCRGAAQGIFRSNPAAHGRLGCAASSAFQASRKPPGSRTSAFTACSIAARNRLARWRWTVRASPVPIAAWAWSPRSSTSRSSPGSPATS